MKNIMAVTVATIACVSCARPEIPVPTPQQAGHVTVSFVGKANSSQTKVFFDPEVTTEAWEKAIGSISVLVFEGAGHLVAQHDYTPDEITAKKATFPLPQSVVQTACSFYAVANQTVADIGTRSELLSMLEGPCSMYNGAIGIVTSKAARPEGFVMTGESSQTIAAGSTTEVIIALERTVAKMAVRTTLSSDFPEKYQGKIQITSAVISGAASRTLLIRPQTTVTGETDYSYSGDQIPAVSPERFDNLFYLFETDLREDDPPVTVTLRGVYDQDGNPETTEDRFPVSYRINLTNPETNGQIIRNGYYRVLVTISGLSDEDRDMTVSVKNWDTLENQFVELG